MIEPKNEIKTACALTPQYLINRWKINNYYGNKEYLKDIIKLKNIMSEEIYRKEFLI